jgi:hypothetical protein
MKSKNQFKKIVLFIVMTALFIVIDLYFADKIYHAHEPVVKGALALTLLILVYLYVIPKRITEESIQLLFTATGIKFLFASVFWAIVSYWAVIQLDDTILYLTKLFKGN